MIVFKRILCATDFSEPAGEALSYARSLSEKYEAELHVLHVLQDVIPLVPEAGLAYLPPPEQLVVEMREEVTKQLDELPGAPATETIREIREGSPVVEIVRYCREKEIDLLVVGTHGRTGLSHFLMGSVAEKAVQKAPCAVLTVRPDAFHFEMP